MINYVDYTTRELSFLVDEYSFNEPITKNTGNTEFLICWEKEGVEIEIVWEMYFSKSAPYPLFMVNNASVQKPFKQILDAYSGCCFNKYHRHEHVRNMVIINQEDNDRRNEILSELFRQRLGIFKRLIIENPQYLWV